MSELRFGDDGYLDMGQFASGQDPSSELFLLPFIQSARHLDVDIIEPAAVNLPATDPFDDVGEAMLDEWDDVIPGDQPTGLEGGDDDVMSGGCSDWESIEWADDSLDDGLA